MRPTTLHYFGSALGPAYGWSTQSPRILSAVERGIQPFSAAHLGMFAWAPPIFSLSSTLANLPPSWPQASSPAVNLPDRPFYGQSSDLAQLGSSPPSVVGQGLPGTAASIPAPLAPIGSPIPPFMGSGSISEAAAPVSFSGDPASPAWPISWPASLGFGQSSTSTNLPGLGASSSPSDVPPAAPPTPASASSVLFTQQSSAFDLGARDRDPNNLDQSAESLGITDWPLSKTGTPFLPPPPPSASSPDQVLAAARLVAPDLVDYFTKPLPPPPPFPSVPGKIPAVDSNPYAPGAIGDALNLALLAASLGETAPLALARMGEEAAPGAVARSLSPAGSNPFRIPLPLDAVLQRLKGQFARGGEETVSASAPNAEPVTAPSVHERLQAHVDAASALLERKGLTDGQLRALRKKPGFAAAYKGDRIDTFAKKTIAGDGSLKHLKTTPRFRFGPDIYDPMNRLWWDITTRETVAGVRKEVHGALWPGISSVLW